ncbi:hypothetical protein MASR1M45_22700 [Candidatus Kapaibacterium sp.]
MSRIAAIIFFLGISSLFAQESRLLRYPNTSESQVSFVYGGDIYIAPINVGFGTETNNSRRIRAISEIFA